MKKMATTLNPTQIHLLRMFSTDNTEKGLQDTKRSCSNTIMKK